MSIVYRWITFPWYNKPIKSNKPWKKKMVLAKSWDKVRLVHFGDSSMKDYTQHKNKNRKKSYCARSAWIPWWWKDKLKANYRARKVLRKC
jgi:hypothetical protein